MTVGLYDQDLINFGFCPPNIDLMKIATYYKSQRDLVSLTLSQQPSDFTEYYYVQDYPGTTNYSALGAKNTHFGGRQLINDTLWLPDGIQRLPSDTSIYRRLYSKLDSQYDRELGDRVMGIEHARLSLDGKTIWKDYRKQIGDPAFSGIMFHDENLTAIAGASTEITKLLQRPADVRKACLATKYPLQINDSHQLHIWSKIPQHTHLCMYSINFMLGPTDIRTIGSRTIQYNITNSFDTEQEFLTMGLENVVSTVIKFQSFNNSMLLIYEPEKIINPTTRMLLDTLSQYSVGGKQKLPIGQFFTEYYPGDMKTLIKLLDYWSPASFKLLKEN